MSVFQDDGPVTVYNGPEQPYAVRAKPNADGSFTARDRKTGAETLSGTRVDLIFGSNSQLRALAEAYATADAGKAFVDAFTTAWAKVMDADRI